MWLVSHVNFLTLRRQLFINSTWKPSLHQISIKRHTPGYRPVDATRSFLSSFCTATQSFMPPKMEEDPSRYCPGGYHPVHIGEMYAERYQVIKKLGFGRYSTVWLARDVRHNKHVALKILTAESYGVENPLYELEILQRVSTADPRHVGYKHVIHLLDNFQHKGPNGTHLCLVFKALGESVSALRRRLPTRQIPAALMKKIAHQVLLGLDYLHQACGIIHTDIKPANILLEIDDIEDVIHNKPLQSPQDRSVYSTATCTQSEALVPSAAYSWETVNVRIADFGVASWVDKHLTEWIQPPSLRAPEVILGVPWDAKVDIWSAACTIFELLQGYMLFNGKPGPKGAWTAEEDHLAQMIELFGPIPSDMLRKGSRSSQYFDENGRMRNIQQFHPFTLEAKIKLKPNKDLHENDVTNFSSFLRSMLQYRPSDRKDAEAAARDPWL